MSVLACDRPECGNTMCDQLVMGRYLCWECLRELDEFRSTWPPTMCESEMRDKLAEFFESAKHSKKLVPTESPEDTEAMFRRLTGLTLG